MPVEQRSAGRWNGRDHETRRRFIRVKFPQGISRRKRTCGSATKPNVECGRNRCWWPCSPRSWVRSINGCGCALHPAKAAGRQGPWPWAGSPWSAGPLLYRAWALLPAGRQSHGNHQSPTRSKPLTGEPCAGDPHARFGGGSGANQCVVPTSILWIFPLQALQVGRDVGDLLGVQAKLGRSEHQ